MHTETGASEQSSREAMAQSLRNISDALSTLVRGHLELARVELIDDLRALGRDSAIATAGLPLLLTGYLMLWVAISLLLTAYIPVWAAFGSAAVFNLAVGGYLVLTATRRARANAPGLPESALELRRNRAWLQSLKEEVRS